MQPYSQSISLGKESQMLGVLSSGFFIWFDVAKMPQ